MTLSGDAEWPKVADAVIEARMSIEKQWQHAEDKRESAEGERQHAEETRQIAEEMRQSADQMREETSEPDRTSGEDRLTQIDERLHRLEERMSQRAADIERDKCRRIETLCLKLDEGTCYFMKQMNACGDE